MSRAATTEPQETKQGSTQGNLIRREILTRDPEIHARSVLDETIVEHYAALMRDGTAEFPPLVVFDDGEQLFIADGFHRDAAVERAGFEVVLCDVRQGSRRDAVLYAIWANARHGLPFTNADKRRAVSRLLRDEEWGRWSDREIARQAAVGKSLVHNMRRKLRPEATGGPRLARRGAQVYELYPSNRERATRATPPAAPLRAAPPAAPVPAPAAAPTPPPQTSSNYVANWLFYLTRMTAPQLDAWRRIIKTRVDISVLAEAVDVVMRQSG